MDYDAHYNQLGSGLPVFQGNRYQKGSRRNVQKIFSMATASAKNACFTNAAEWS